MKRRQFLATLGLLAAAPTAIKATDATPAECQHDFDVQTRCCTKCGESAFFYVVDKWPHVTYNGPIAYSNGTNALFWKVK